MIKEEALWIFGAGDLARLAKFYFERELGQKVSGFIVDEQYHTSESRDGSKLLTWSEFLGEVNAGGARVFPAIGYRSMRARELVFDKISSTNHQICNLVCTSAFIASNVRLGMGVFVMPGVVIEPGVTVGNNNVFWSNSTICHDSVIGRHNFIASNSLIGGRVKVGNRCFLGFSSVVGQDVEICDDVLIGANSYLKNSINFPGVFLGSPATRKRDVDPSAGVCLST